MLFIHVGKRLSSNSQMFFKTGVLKNFTIFTEKTLVLESLFNKVTGLKACTFIKKRLQHRCFPMNHARFSKTAFLWNICLLYFSEGLCGDEY